MLSAQVSLPEAEEQRRRAQEEAEERQRLQESPQVHLQAPEPPTEEEQSLALPLEFRSFTIDRFVLSVPGSLPAAHRAWGKSRRRSDPFHYAMKYLNQYQGRRIGPEGIKLIIRRLTRRILTRGHTTTRVDLPEQDLSTGTLELTLIPGIIRTIRFADPALRGTWRSAFPARPGDLLNIRDLEQGLEQMKRVPSQDVSIGLIPGALPGESEVVLTLKRGRPWRLGVSLDDSGLPATGQWQAALNASWDNPLGRSDWFSAGLSHDVTAYQKGCGTRGGSLTYSMPMGYWTFSSSWNQNEYAQRIAGTGQDNVFSGDSRNLDARVSYLFNRGQATKDTVQLRIGNRISSSFLNGAELDVQRRNNSHAELSLTHTHYLGRAQLDLTGSHRQGVSWFGAEPDLETGGPTFYYRLQTLDATLAVPFVIGRRSLHYTATVRGQHTRDQLYALDYLTIGNRWTVRGFEGAVTLASECGGFLRNDLECPLGRRASVYLGIDAGRVYGANEGTLPGRTLAGAVLGLKGVIKKNLSFNLFLGGPLHQPENFPNQWPVVGVSASFQL